MNDIETQKCIVCKKDKEIKNFKRNNQEFKSCNECSLRKSENEKLRKERRNPENKQNEEEIKRISKEILFQV